MKNKPEISRKSYYAAYVAPQEKAHPWLQKTYGQVFERLIEGKKAWIYIPDSGEGKKEEFIIWNAKHLKFITK